MIARENITSRTTAAFLVPGMATPHQMTKSAATATGIALVSILEGDE